MADSIDRYRLELERDLRRRMPAYSAQLIAEEAEAHLRDRCAASMELGASPETAQLEAIQTFGSAESLATEFGRQATVWAIGPRTGNLAMFLLFMIPVVYEYGFLHYDYVNLVTVLSWFTVPALCRRWPIWGTLVGIAVIEVVLAGTRVTHEEEWKGIATMLGMTLVSYGLGWLVRKAIVRWRDRRRILTR